MNSEDRSKKIRQILESETEEIIEKESLEKRLKSGKKLTIKLGADPTAPDLHLGHSICLKKMKEFQDLGHRIVFIVGDFTAKIGDPSGKTKTRPPLSDEEIKKNTKTYFEQVGKILDVKKIEVRKNSEWFSKMGLADFLKLASNFTVARILERDDFQKRMESKKEIAFHEVVYPLLQSYDSFIIGADVELGGSDQRFNILTARDFQQKMGQTPQDVILLPILLGLDGEKKMSKSLGNYIGITEAPKEQYGKIMSIADSLIIHYFDLCTDVSKEELEIIKKDFNDPQKNPRDLKARLAREIVSIYHGVKKAEEAENEFNKIFRDKQINENDYAPGKSGGTVQEMVLREFGPTGAASRRLIEQGGLKILSEEDQEFKAVKDWKRVPQKGEKYKIGKKKFIKIQ